MSDIVDVGMFAPTILGHSSRSGTSAPVRKAEAELGISYGRANKLVGRLVKLELLDVVDPNDESGRQPTAFVIYSS